MSDVFKRFGGILAGYVEQDFFAASVSQPASVSYCLFKPSLLKGHSHDACPGMYILWCKRPELSGEKGEKGKVVMRVSHVRMLVDERCCIVDFVVYYDIEILDARIWLPSQPPKQSLGPSDLGGTGLPRLTYLFRVVG